MSFDGSGNYSPPTPPAFPAVTGTVISSTYFNAIINDLATALSSTLCKDGQSTVSANLPMNGHKFTGLGAPTASGDSATKGYVDGRQNILRAVDYGVIADGVTNDTTTFATAAAAAAAAGKILMLPTGGTILTDRVVMAAANVFWQTEGAACTIKLNSGVDNDLVYGANVSNVVLNNIIFDGNKSVQTLNVDLVSNNGLQIVKGSAVELKSCSFINCLENGARLIAIDGFKSYNCIYANNSHNGMYCTGHIDGTAFQSFYCEEDFSYSNATDGMNFEENCHDGVIVFPRASNNGASHVTYAGGTGILFYGGETIYQPRDIVVYGARTIGNYGGGLYVVSGSEMSIVNASSLNDGATGIVGETDFGNSFAAYCNGSGAHGASQTISNVRFINPVSRGAGKAGFYSYSSTAAITGLRVESADIQNPSSLSSNAFDGMSLNNCTAPVILDPVINDTRGTKLMRYAMRLQSGVTSARVRYNKDDIGTGLTAKFSNASISVRPECSWVFSQAYSMPTIGANTDYFATGIAITDLTTNDVINLTCNQGSNALALEAHPSAANTATLTVRNRGGGSFTGISVTLRGVVTKTDLS